MRIAVYLGANEGNRPIYAEAVAELGHWIGENGHSLVYGGSKAGLMGLLADAALEAGADVIGVEPQFFIDIALQHPGINELIVTQTMAERKVKMMELADAFVAFPGGTGTLEEIVEIISQNSLDLMKKPYVFYNLEGYYDHLAAMFDKMVEEGFVLPEKRALTSFAADLEGIEKALMSDS